mmetsp:Transcript_15618/g.26567  ORF Transcript_15618/g.26567 Transcript_15618/m.26567 type:complete len:107 (+) Transcript_15618:648-968(+)
MRSLRTFGGSARAHGTQRMNIATSSRPIFRNGSIVRGKQAAGAVMRIVDGPAETIAAGTKVQGIGDRGRVLWCLRQRNQTATRRFGRSTGSTEVHCFTITVCSSGC